MCHSEEIVVAKALSGEITASPKVVEKGISPKAVYEGIRSAFISYPEYFMFTIFSGNLKDVPMKLNVGDELKIRWVALGKTREEQEIINDAFHAIFDENVGLDVAFASLSALKIVFGVKQGVTFLEMPNRDDVALIILDGVMDGTIFSVTAQDDGMSVVVNQVFDLFDYYKERFTFSPDELKNDGEEFRNWVNYVANLAVRYGELLKSDSEHLNVLRQKIQAMPKERYDLLLSAVRTSISSGHFPDPIKLIETA